MDIIKSIEHEQMKSRIPELKVGNTVKVHVRVKEGNRERIQVFEGTIIKVQGGGVNQTFTVRRISYGVGVEKTFLVHSPAVEKVEVTRVGKARRAKLFFYFCSSFFCYCINNFFYYWSFCHFFF